MDIEIEASRLSGSHNPGTVGANQNKTDNQENLLLESIDVRMHTMHLITLPEMKGLRVPRYHLLNWYLA
jgi:hypothetical protein